MEKSGDVLQGATQMTQIEAGCMKQLKLQII